MKKTKKWLAFVLMMIFTFSFSVQAFAATAIPAISSGKTITCYTINSSGKIYAYTAANLKTKTGGYINCATDECQILKISGNAVQVKYSVKGGTRTAWFQRSAFTACNIAKGADSKWTQATKMTTYRRSDGKNSFGYVSQGDVCYKLTVKGNYTQILYPLSKTGGYKMGWVRTADINDAILSDSELKSAASAYGISTNSNGYKALQSINTTYAKQLNADQKKGTLVFFFEGVGSNSSSSKRMNAMCVVVKNNKIVYLNRNSSTIPDAPFSPERNGNTAMPTIKSGIYSFTTKNHKSSYAALNVTSAKVLRFNSKKSYYDSTSAAINIHRRDSDSLKTSFVNSAGCLLVGKSGKASSDEYAKFIQAVGIVKKGASGTSKYTTSVKGTVIVDRTYASSYLKSIGYSSDAIKKLQ